MKPFTGAIRHVCFLYEIKGISYEPNIHTGKPFRQSDSNKTTERSPEIHLRTKNPAWLIDWMCESSHIMCVWQSVPVPCPCAWVMAKHNWDIWESQTLLQLPQHNYFAITWGLKSKWILWIEVHIMLLWKGERWIWMLKWSKLLHISEAFTFF